MTVCKCDRCGKYMDKDVIPRIKGCVDPIRCTHYKNDIVMDLCPECYALLREFLGYHDYKPEDNEEETPRMRGVKIYPEEEEE